MVEKLGKTAEDFGKMSENGQNLPEKPLKWLKMGDMKAKFWRNYWKKVKSGGKTGKMRKIRENCES